jgi:hypothetical protein
VLQIALSRLQSEIDVRLDALRDNMAARTEEQIYTRASLREFEDFRGDIQQSVEALTRGFEERMDKLLEELKPPDLTVEQREELRSLDGIINTLRDRIASLEDTVKKTEEAKDAVHDAVLMSNQKLDALLDAADAPTRQTIAALVAEAFDVLSRQLTREIRTEIEQRPAGAPPAAMPASPSAPLLPGDMATQFEALRAEMRALLETRSAAVESVREEVRDEIINSIREHGLKHLFFTPEEEPAAEPSDDNIPRHLTEDEAVTYFGRKITRSILGKSVTREIYSDDHTLIAKKDAVVDENMIELARQKGKFLDLSLNVR